MVWGAISARGATDICIIKDSIDQYKYQDILNEYLIETMTTLYPEGYIFMQDNAPHKAAPTMEWLADRKIRVLDWPACSPDLNPIESLWKSIKHEIEKLGPTRVDNWKQTIINVWCKFTGAGQDSYFASTDRRLEMVIILGGAKINY